MWWYKKGVEYAGYEQ